MTLHAVPGLCPDVWAVPGSGCARIGPCPGLAVPGSGCARIGRCLAVQLPLLVYFFLLLSLSLLFEKFQPLAQVIGKELWLYL